MAVLVGTRTERGRDLNGYPPFLDFVSQELLPWIRRRYRIADDPAHCVVGALNLGSVAAAATALKHPDIFGNVLCQSGAFWRGRDSEVEGEWLTRAFAMRERLLLRFSMDVGLLENPRDVPGATLLCANRHLRTVLQAKGYDVHYVEFNGGHQHLNWQGTLPDSVIALIGT